jgi:hypothetical protein
MIAIIHATQIRFGSQLASNLPGPWRSAIPQFHVFL